MTSSLIDNVVYHDTPEGISLLFVPAGIVSRVLAALIDLLVRIGLFLIFVVILSFFDQLGAGLLSIVAFLLMWFYPVFFDLFYDGQTIGKRLLKLSVCMDNGLPVTWQASMIRNLLMVADFLPVMFCVGMVTMLFHGRAKRLGDMVAGTMVVHRPAVLSVVEDVMAHPAILPPMALSLDEQQAILNFVARAKTLPDDRIVELASILTQMTGKQDIDEVGDEILGYANAIVGTKASSTTQTVE